MIGEASVVEMRVALNENWVAVQTRTVATRLLAAIGLAWVGRLGELFQEPLGHHHPVDRTLSLVQIVSHALHQIVCLLHKLVFRVACAGEPRDLVEQERVPTNALDGFDQVVFEIFTRVASLLLGQQVVAFLLEEEVQSRASGGVLVKIEKSTGTDLTELAVEEYGLLLERMNERKKDKKQDFLSECLYKNRTRRTKMRNREWTTHKSIECFGHTAIHFKGCLAVCFCQLDLCETDQEGSLALEYPERAAYKTTKQ